jgi:hypothetical protein
MRYPVLAQDTKSLENHARRRQKARMAGEIRKGGSMVRQGKGNSVTRLLAVIMLMAGNMSLAAPVPAFAQNWGVQPAPPSWGLPAPQAPARPERSVAPSATQGAAAQEAPAFQQAVQCSAALQLANLAAPDWARQPGVRPAVDQWLQRAFATASEAGVNGDQVSAAVQTEMNRQAEDAARDPGGLSRRAFDCAARTGG